MEKIFSCLRSLVGFLLVGGLLLAAGNSLALELAFSDPVGDHSGIVDVVGMDLSVNESSGVYTIDIFADAANPFISNFRININLFNVTQDEFFQSAFNDFDVASALTSIQLAGTSSTMLDWLDTDLYATTSLQGLGSPTGHSSFRSSVADLPFGPILASEDIIGYNDRGAPVPEPATFLLLGAGLLVVAWSARSRKRG